MHRVLRAFLLVSFGLGGGCEAEGSGVGGPYDCDSFSVRLYLPERVTASPIGLRGTAYQQDNAAIQTITVASVKASADLSNFKTFSVLLNREALLALPRAQASPKAGAAGAAGAACAANERYVEVPVQVVAADGRTCEISGPFTTILAIADAEDGDGVTGAAGAPNNVGGTGGASGSVGASGSGGTSGAPGFGGTSGASGFGGTSGASGSGGASGASGTTNAAAASAGLPAGGSAGSP